MRHLLTIIFSFFLFFGVFSQPPTDFYFKTPIPAQCKELKKTPASFHGQWQSKKDTMRSFIITENKIISQYKHLMILSKKEFTNAGYKLKDGFLYGFAKNDSLPAIMKNDTVIFCYISESEIIHLVKETGNEFLTEIGGKLILSQKEDSLFRYTLISIKNNELVLSEVLHEPELKKVLELTKALTVKNKNEEDILYVADIDKKKMEKFISQGFFNDIQNCQRIIE
jgi:hypothetical protein